MQPSVPSQPEQPATTESSNPSETLNRLVDCAHVDLREVHVRQLEGVVRLQGRVNSFHAKQWAQILAGDAFVESRIENAIEVD